MDDKSRWTRRDWLASVFAGAGLIASYGILSMEGLLFILPDRGKPKTRKLFAGRIDQYEIDAVQKFHDLRGGEILVKRGRAGFQAFSSTCPHLGCKVRWESDQQRYFCPCHRGTFDSDGVAVSGPPADAGQNLTPVALEVDETSGVLYIEVEDIKIRRQT